MGERLLRLVGADEVRSRVVGAVDVETERGAREIVEDVAARGAAAVREYAERFGERGAGDALVIGTGAMSAALEALNGEDRGALERAAERVRVFAEAQLGAVSAVEIGVPGGVAGHTVEVVESAGCYAPGGRYPLPSSVLMGAVTARAAGVGRVVVASPGAHPVALAAAAVAGADAFLAVGGAHAIGAMAFGLDGSNDGADGVGFGWEGGCDVIVGPGNRWVTAAKRVVSDRVGIDMLAGPSELLVLADGSADAGTVAADLLAQAEHDVDASAMLVTTDAGLVDAVEAELRAQVDVLATRETALAGLANGFACVASGVDEMIELADTIAAEHLEVMTGDSAGVAARVRHAGGVFIGAGSAEVFGDYGAGPNHTLPTGGTSRFTAGLSVMDFVRLRTYLRIDDAEGARGLVDDTERLARMEGLAGHAASAARRRV